MIDLEAEEVEGVDDEVTKALKAAALEPSEAAEDPREPKAGARPYDPQEDAEQPPAPREPPLKPLSEAMFGPNPDAKLDGPTVKRLAGLAAEVIGDEWIEQIATWVKTNYHVEKMSDLPASAEVELMKWLDR